MSNNTQTDSQPEGLAPAQSSGKPVARKLGQAEYCCVLVGHNNFPGRYLAHGIHPCRRNAKWEIAGKYYCTHHATKRLADFQNAKPEPEAQ